MRLTSLAVVLFLAAALNAVAQPQPYASVPVATNVSRLVLRARLFTDFDGGRSFVVTDQQVTVVNHSNQSIEVKPLSAPAGADTFTDSCMNPTTGVIATTWHYTFSAAQHPMIVQTLKYNGPGNWEVKPLNLGLSEPKNFAGSASCAFDSDGTLWLASNGQQTANLPKIVHADIENQTVLGSWTSDEFPFVGVATSPTGVYFSAWSGATATIAVATLSDNGYKILAQSKGSFSGALAASPDGEAVYAGPIGLSIPDLSQLAIVSQTMATAWPTQNDGFAYVARANSLEAWNMSFKGGTMAKLLDLSVSGASYLDVVARRGSDGKDLVIALRNGALDFYLVDPPATLFSVTSAAAPDRPKFLAPGSIISFFGQGLGDWGQNDAADMTQMVYQLGSVQALYDGKPIRLHYAGYGQVNAILPENTTLGTHTFAVQHGDTVLSQRITIVEQALTAFQIPDFTRPGHQLLALTNAAGHVLGPTGPAKVNGAAIATTPYVQASCGDVAVLYGTGGGVTALHNDGIPIVPADRLYPLTNTPQVLIDGAPATIQFAGLSPGSIPGLNQINFVVPMGLSSGPHDVELVLSTGVRVPYPQGLWVQ